MESDNETNQKLEKVLSMTDNSKDNIFHMCSSNRQTETLLTICNSSKISKKCIQDGLIQENSDGRTALDLCKDENALLIILSNFDHTTHKLSSTEKEGKISSMTSLERISAVQWHCFSKNCHQSRIER